MPANPVSFDEAHSGPAATIPGIGPVFRLQEQVEQAACLDRKLLAARWRQGPTALSASHIRRRRGCLRASVAAA